jgi:fructokinase
MSILVAGEALVDVIQHADSRLSAVAGGGPYNLARTIGRLGQPVAFVGRLSTDRFGRLLRDHLASDGVDLRFAVSTEDPTTLAMAEIGADGSASYRFYTQGTSAAGYRVEDLPAALDGVDAVEMGSIALAFEPTATALLTLAGRLPADVLLMVDPNCRPGVIGEPDAYRARLRQVFARSDVVKASTEDLEYLVPGRTPDEAAADLLALGPAVVLITDGPREVRAVTGDGGFRVPVPPVKVVDTIGAGDSFGGAFLAWWIGHGHGRSELGAAASLRAAVEFGIRVAGRTSSRPGADPPTFDELGGWGD